MPPGPEPYLSRITAMHEVSLVAELISECERRSAGRPVQLVRVRHASSIAEPVLRQAFRMLTEGSRMADTTLESETFDVELRCGCGFEGSLGHDDLIGGSVAVCPACGDVSTLRRTAELELIEVRMAS
jgi:Zn finger protein HypA/HybF involved in hydrogenase expression